MIAVEKINFARRAGKNSSKSEIHFTSEVTPDFFQVEFFLLLAF